METLLYIFCMLSPAIIVFASLSKYDISPCLIGVRDFVRVFLVIVLTIFIATHITQCNQKNEYHRKAKICGLGHYSKATRITAVLDSLCSHNCVRFGELLTDFDELRDIYMDNSKPNDYIVGCRDTISGDVLEIELTICKMDTYIGDMWETDFYNEIKKITLKNANGIAKSGYSIDPAYLRGGSGFENGYCAVLNDTCAMIF